MPSQIIRSDFLHFLYYSFFLTKFSLTLNEIVKSYIFFNFQRITVIIYGTRVQVGNNKFAIFISAALGNGGPHLKTHF